MLHSCKAAIACMQEHVKREKRLMASCDCPFIVNLVTSFQDDSCLYLLLESVMGGEFFTYLQVPATAQPQDISPQS